MEELPAAGAEAAGPEEVPAAGVEAPIINPARVSFCLPSFIGLLKITWLGCNERQPFRI